MADELAVYEEPIPAPPLTLFGTNDPVEVLAKAIGVANVLADLLERQKLYKVIGTKKHVLVEGWTLLGAMLGVFAQIEWTKKLEDRWEARAVATVAATGTMVGAGDAQCTHAESTWRSRDDYALRAMAQTRAISRAMRGPLGFVVQLAGFDAAPADEMPSPQPEFQGPRAVPLGLTSTANSVEPPPLAPTARPPRDGHGEGAPVSPVGVTTGAPRSPSEILSDARKKTPPARYADEDMVCPGCGRKEFIRPYQGSFFCSKRDGGCGTPRKNEKWVVISYGEFRQKHSGA